MSNNKLSKRDGIKTLIENNKSRLALTNEEELSIWGDSVKKLVDLGEFILNHTGTYLKWLSQFIIH